MTIGEKIKSLRKKGGVTQEKLAEYLNITYQSISKWENNTAVPDISLVVPLANFFGVTTDELFDLDSAKKEEQIKEYDEKSLSLRNRGEVRKNLDLWRQASTLYPNNYHCLASLASALLSSVCSCGFSDEERESAKNEGIAICNRVLDDCTDDEIRSDVTQSLVYLYSMSDNEEMAVAVAQKAPCMYCSKEILLEGAYNHYNPKFTETQQSNDSSFLDLIHQDILLADRNTNEDKIRAYKALLTIWNTLFYDGNFLFFHCRIGDIYGKLAQVYADMQDKENALDCLKKAAFHAREFDTLPVQETKYTGIFFDSCTYVPEQTTRNYTQTHTDMVRELTGRGCFDFMRNDPEFVGFTESLR